MCSRVFKIFSSSNFTKLIPGQSNRLETKTMEATTPELGPVRLWSPKSSSFSGSDSIVVEEAEQNFPSPPPSVNKSGAPNFFIQHDKVEDSKLRRYLETFGRALELFLQRRTSSTTPLSRQCRSTMGVKHLYVSVRSRFSVPPSVAQYSGNESSCNLQHFGV